MSMRTLGWPRAGRWLCLVAVATVLVAGCSFASGMIRTLNALGDAGIHNPDISGGSDRVTLTYDSTADPSGLRSEQDRAAEVIWDNFPLRFSELTVVARSSTGESPEEQTYSRSELEEQFGPRPSGLDNTTGDVEKAARDTARTVVIGLLIGGIVLLALVVLVIVLVVRASRRRPAAPVPAAAGWGQAQAGAPQHGWGPPPPGWGPPQQPGYGPPGAQPGYGPPGYGPPTSWQPPGAPQQGYGQPGYGPPTEAPPPEGAPSDETQPIDRGTGERPPDQGPTPPR